MIELEAKGCLPLVPSHLFRSTAWYSYNPYSSHFVHNDSLDFAPANYIGILS
jgi:hypothetical protein